MYMRDNILIVSYYLLTYGLRFNISVSLNPFIDHSVNVFGIHKMIDVPIVGIYVYIKQHFEKKWKYFVLLLIHCCEIFGFLNTKCCIKTVHVCNSRDTVGYSGKKQLYKTIKTHLVKQNVMERLQIYNIK